MTKECGWCRYFHKQLPQWKAVAWGLGGTFTTASETCWVDDTPTPVHGHCAAWRPTQFLATFEAEIEGLSAHQKAELMAEKLLTYVEHYPGPR